MPSYLVLGKYSKEGFATAVEEGFETRADALRSSIEGLGGELEMVYFCPAYSGHDFVFILTAPTADVVQMMSLAASTSAGIADGGTVIELKTAAEVDAAVQAMQQAAAQ